ncbi:protein OSCP1 isoform X2 [Armigeres subalbatus]|uniref:protein OSCP1 isoform X2 n=1 Tax=Armigeres subalbatus TaxID=124917 RepID=UPI002ED152F9
MTITNLFIILNLGCEMLYVIDQRLKAQAIPLDKSAQVLREITEVLLDPKFLHYISTAYQHNMLTVQQTRILLTDIACCSLMRLDVNSMDKLWDLMIMIFKWQMNLTNKSAQILMDLTFRHLDGIGRLIPEMRKQILIDNVKKSLIEMWEPLCEDDQTIVHRRVYKWLKPYTTKISILIRMGLQKSDANLQDLKNQIEQTESECKSVDLAAKSNEIETLVEQLNVCHTCGEIDESENSTANAESVGPLHGGLNEIVIEHNSDSVTENEKNKDGNELLGSSSEESNLTKFMKKIKIEDSDFVVKQVVETNPHAELLKMFDQNIDL